jgi:hypothetical protein
MIFGGNMKIENRRFGSVDIDVYGEYGICF